MQITVLPKKKKLPMLLNVFSTSKMHFPSRKLIPWSKKNLVFLAIIIPDSLSGRPGHWCIESCCLASLRKKFGLVGWLLVNACLSCEMAWLAMRGPLLCSGCGILDDGRVPLRRQYTRMIRWRWRAACPDFHFGHPAPSPSKSSPAFPMPPSKLFD